MITKEKLEQLYVVKQMSLKEIGDFFKVAESTVLRYMVEYNIPRRPAVKKSFRPEEQELKKLHCVEGKTLTEIAQKYNVSRYLVSDWFNYYNIEVNYFKYYKIPDEDLLRELYVVQNMTVIQLCDIFKVERRIVNKWLNTYNIEIRSTQRKFAHLRRVPFTQNQKEFIVGTLLGDGFLSESNVLQLKHSVKQVKYLLWKKDIMKNFVNNVYTKKEKFGECVRWHSITHPEFAFFRKLFYSNNKKIIKNEIGKFLTPFALAIWVMDDGWRSKNSIHISSESFSEDEHKTLQWLIKVNFDLNVKICTYVRNDKKYHYLTFNKRNSILLTKIISPYVIESMKYKLIPEEVINESSETSTPDS